MALSAAERAKLRALLVKLREAMADMRTRPQYADVTAQKLSNVIDEIDLWERT